MRFTRSGACRATCSATDEPQEWATMAAECTLLASISASTIFACSSGE